MKGKQLALVLILLVALGAIAWFLNRRNAATWSSTATASNAKILAFPLNDVSHVSIKGSGAELNLIKKDDAWRVVERADYPANFELISGLLRKLWELRAVQDVKIGPSQFSRLQLVEPGKDSNSGTLLDLKGVGEKQISSLLLGKRFLKNSEQPATEGGSIPSGRYVKPGNSDRVFLVAETLDEVDAKPERWLSRDFINIETPKSIAVGGAAAGMNWKIARGTASAPWQLLDAKPGEELDSAKASGLTTLVAGVSFADVSAPNAPSAETGLDKPSTMTIETIDNFVYTLRIGKLMGENYPVLVSVAAQLPKERSPGKDEKPEEKTKLDEAFKVTQKRLSDKLEKEQKLEKRPYLIAKTTMDQLLKDRSALLAEKKMPSAPNASAAPSPSRRRPK